MTSETKASAQVRLRTSTPAFCPHHCKNQAVFVCLKPACDDEFACVECVAKRHRGHEMEKLELFASMKKQILKTKVETAKDTVLVYLQQNITTAEEKLSLNKTMTKDEQKRIFERCDAMKEELDKIARRYAEDCRSTGEMTEKNLAAHRQFLESQYTQYKTSLDNCDDVIEEGSLSDIVLAEKEFPPPPDIPDFPENHVLKLTFQETPFQQFEQIFGDLISMNAYSPRNEKLTKLASKESMLANPNAPTIRKYERIEKLPVFELKSDTSGVCGSLYPLVDQMYVWFYDSFTLSRVTTGGKDVKAVTLQQPSGKDDYIRNMCLSLADETIWSVSKYGRIQQVSQDGELGQNIPYFVGKEEKPMSLCVTHSEELVVGVINPNQIIIFNKEGEECKKVSDLGLDEYPDRITQCRTTGRLAITDHSSVSVMDEMYGRLYTVHGSTLTSPDGSNKETNYTSEKDFHPIDMCFDSDGNLLVADRNSCNVIMFNRDGQYICTIVQETGGKVPCTINTSPSGALWVAYKDGAVKKFVYK